MTTLLTILQTLMAGTWLVPAIIALVAVLVVAGVFVAVKRNKKTKTTQKIEHVEEESKAMETDEVAVVSEVVEEIAEDDDEDEDEEDEKSEAKAEAKEEGREVVLRGIEELTGLAIVIRFKKSFKAKLIQAPQVTKEHYNTLKNSVVQYKKISDRVSWNYESINTGRQQLVKFNVRGKTLYVYMALDAAEFADTKYKVQNVTSKKYENVPCLFKIKNARRAKYCLELFEVLAKKYDLVPQEAESVDYVAANPYDTTENLVKRQLIKEIITKEKYEEFIEKQAQMELDENKREFVTAKEVNAILSDETAKALVTEKVEVKATNQKSGKKVRAIVNVDTISGNFQPNDQVNLSTLKEKKLISKGTNHVKVLARGELNKPLMFEVNEYSLDAVKMIQLTGGKTVRLK